MRPQVGGPGGRRTGNTSRLRPVPAASTSPPPRICATVLPRRFGGWIMFDRNRVLALTGALVVSVVPSTAARSDGVIIGLVDNKTLVTIDPTTRKVLSEQTIR